MNTGAMKLSLSSPFVSEQAIMADVLSPRHVPSGATKGAPRWTAMLGVCDASILISETVGGAQRGPQRVRPLGLHGVFVVKRHVIISNLCPQELPNASLDDSNVSTQAESPEEVVPVFPQDQRFLGFQLHPIQPGGSAPTTLSQDIRGRGPSVSGVFVPSQRDRSDVRHNDLLRGFSGPAGTHCRRERKYQDTQGPLHLNRGALFSPRTRHQRQDVTDNC
ncbi:unnamed protein product [Arctogadus glacialis]